ncbi:MAG: hypothetical protein AB1695_05125 [Stygiobacter sp.]
MENQQQIGCFKTVFSIVLLLFVLSFLFRTCSGNSDSDDSESMALVMSRNFVRDKLLSPSTAEFAGLSDSRVIKKENVWYINSYVDAKNAFGVAIRKNYSCRLIYKPDEKVWSLLEMNLE